MVCNLCDDNEKEWALKCGHMFCTKCIENLESDRTTPCIPHIDSFGREHYFYDYPIPKECAYCKGTLEGKIKLFFM